MVWLWAPPRARERVLCFAATSWCSCPRSCLQLFVMMRVFATIVMIHEADDLAKVRYLHVLCFKFFHLSNRKMKLQRRAPKLHSLCCAEYRTFRFPRARVRAPGALAASCLTETHPERVVRVLIAWHCNVDSRVVRPERNSAADVACKKAFSASLGGGLFLLIPLAAHTPREHFPCVAACPLGSRCAGGTPRLASGYHELRAPNSHQRPASKRAGFCHRACLHGTQARA